MVIEDWQKTPIYSILVNDQRERDAMLKCLNKATINRLASDLVERREFTDRVELREKNKNKKNLKLMQFIRQEIDSEEEE